MNADRFTRAVELIDQANAEDPNREIFNGLTYPKELLYGQRMSACLERLRPDAQEALRLAARAQHLRRWQVPRTDYPATREGYHRWRTFLYGYHADQAESLLRQVGYGDDIIAAVRRMVGKQGMRKDPDVQTVEDVACLVFLEYYFPAFAQSRDEDQLVDIVRKTWRKMSEAGHRMALQLTLPEPLAEIVGKALAVG
jgi:hypothetical protein